MIDCFISKILAKIHHSLLVLNFGTTVTDRSRMKVRLSAKLSLRKTRKRHKVFIFNAVQISFIKSVLSVLKSFILLTQRWTRREKAWCIAIETALISAYWRYWKLFCKLSASLPRWGEWFLSISKRSLRTYTLYFAEGDRFCSANARKGNLKALIHKDIFQFSWMST